MRHKESLTGQNHLSSKAEMKIVQLHRLLVFEKVFSEYLEGKATAADVRTVADKMLQVGLPDQLK
jgi:hypothetical protein